MRFICVCLSAAGTVDCSSILCFYFCLLSVLGCYFLFIVASPFFLFIVASPIFCLLLLLLFFVYCCFSHFLFSVSVAIFFSTF